MREQQLDEFELNSRGKMLDAIVHHEASLIRQHFTDLALRQPRADYGKIEAAHAKAVQQLLAWSDYFKARLRGEYSDLPKKEVEEPKSDYFPLTRQRWSAVLKKTSQRPNTLLEDMIHRMCIAFMLGWTTGVAMQEFMEEREALLDEIQKQLKPKVAGGRATSRDVVTALFSPPPKAPSRKP